MHGHAHDLGRSAARPPQRPELLSDNVQGQLLEPALGHDPEQRLVAVNGQRPAALADEIRERQAFSLRIGDHGIERLARVVQVQAEDSQPAFVCNDCDPVRRGQGRVPRPSFQLKLLEWLGTGIGKDRGPQHVESPDSHPIQLGGLGQHEIGVVLLPSALGGRPRVDDSRRCPERAARMLGKEHGAAGLDRGIVDRRRIYGEHPPGVCREIHQARRRVVGAADQQGLAHFKVADLPATH
jgi:hypothetical protein